MNAIKNIVQRISVHSVVCILFYGLFSRFFVKKGAVSRTLKMQNKAKFKTAKIPVPPFILSNYKNALHPPQPKNKPKQTQIKDTADRISSLSATQALCHPEHSEVLWAERSRRIYLNSHPPSGGFRIFDILSLILDMLFMTNEPNFPWSLNNKSHCLLRTKNKERLIASPKNKPNQTQYESKVSNRVDDGVERFAGAHFFIHQVGIGEIVAADVDGVALCGEEFGGDLDFVFF
jgi:hypothetical protein